MLEQIPDVSGEEVDDINDITYDNKKITEEICSEAKKKLSSLSSSSLRSQNIVENQDGTIHLFRGQIQEEPELKVKRGKTKNHTKNPSLRRKISDIKNCQDRLFPALNRINEDELPKVPPPTYSDSENFYATIKSKSSSVLPSAPYLNVDTNNNRSLTHNNDCVRQKLTPYI